SLGLPLVLSATGHDAGAALTPMQRVRAALRLQPTALQFDRRRRGPALLVMPGMKGDTMTERKRITVGGGTYHKWQGEGEQLVGEWGGFELGKAGMDGKPMVSGKLDTASGELKFSAGTVLRTKLGMVREGYTVWITYLGKRKGKGAEYRDFSVEVDDPE